MQKEFFYTAISHPFSLSEQERETLDDIVRSYPFFQAAQILRLQNAYGEEKYERLLPMAGIHISAPRYYYKNLMLNKIYLKPQSVSGSKNKKDVEIETVAKEKQEETLQYAPSFYKIEESETENTVDFEKETLDFTDWLSALEHPETEKKKHIPKKAQKTAETISYFINNDKKPTLSKTKEKEVVETKKEHSQEQLMSQTLAEIYVKQRLYDKAITIYKKLDLNSSEKNTTFARRIEEINELKKN